MYKNYRKPDRVSYYNWMMQEHPEGSTKGNAYARRLANDIRADVEFPTRGEYREIRSYLKAKGATEDVLEVFMDTWAAFQVSEGTRKAHELYGLTK